MHFFIQMREMKIKYLHFLQYFSIGNLAISGTWHILFSIILIEKIELYWITYLFLLKQNPYKFSYVLNLFMNVFCLFFRTLYCNQQWFLPNCGYWGIARKSSNPRHNSYRAWDFRYIHINYDLTSNSKKIYFYSIS